PSGQRQPTVLGSALLCQPEQDARIAGHRIAAVGLNAPGRAAMTCQLDTRLDGIALVAAIDDAKADPMPTMTALVEEYPHGTTVVEHDDVGVTVVVEIPGRRTSRDL